MGRKREDTRLCPRFSTWACLLEHACHPDLTCIVSSQIHNRLFSACSTHPSLISNFILISSVCLPLPYYPNQTSNQELPCRSHGFLIILSLK
jgi:hypothetical protein